MKQQKSVWILCQTKHVYQHHKRKEYIGSYHFLSQPLLRSRQKAAPEHGACQLLNNVAPVVEPNVELSLELEVLAVSTLAFGPDPQISDLHAAEAGYKHYPYGPSCHIDSTLLLYELSYQCSEDNLSTNAQSVHKYSKLP